MANKKGIIICGFAGIGKSTAAKNIAGVIDLESTPFEKDWSRYVKVANHMANNGYIVLVSCHADLRNAFHKENIDYLLAMPDKGKKEEYIKRYKARGNSDEFIKLLDTNWDGFLSVFPHEKNIITVSMFLQDQIELLLGVERKDATGILKL